MTVMQVLAALSIKACLFPFKPSRMAFKHFLYLTAVFICYCLIFPAYVHVLPPSHSRYRNPVPQENPSCQSVLQCCLMALFLQEDVVNRVWACYLALDDPYYTLLSQLYVENDLYENVRIQFDMSPTTFERYRKKALHLIIEYTKSPLSVGELITGSSGKIHKPQNRAPA